MNHREPAPEPELDTVLNLRGQKEIVQGGEGE